MKNESQRVAEQLKRAFDGAAWHGPSLKEALADVTIAQAIARPVATAHTIWELVAHIAAWEDVVVRRLNGESIGEPPVDFPAAPADPDWDALLARAFEAHDRLVAQVESLTEEDLRRRIDDQPYPAWFMVHGVVGHALYHVGQIMILKHHL